MRAHAAALAAAALILAGCGDEESIRGGGTIIGETLTVASMLPFDGADAAAVQDLVAGQKLALYEAGGKVGAFKVNFVSWNEGTKDPADVARDVIHDGQVVAVIGALHSNTARQTVPIVNAAGVLHVSPGAADPAVTTDPRLYPSGRPNFRRVVADADGQAKAMLDAAGPGPVAVEQEAGEEPAALAGALRRAAAGRLVDDPARARVVVYAGEDPANALGVAEALAREAPRATVVFGEGLARNGAIRRIPRRTGPLATRTLTIFGPLPAKARYVTGFRARFGRDPGPYGQVGYEAMKRVLAAIRRAGGNANRRQSVIDAYGEPEPLAPTIFTLRPRCAEFRPSCRT